MNNYCHMCTGPNATEMIKCRCAECDGLEQDVCDPCAKLYTLSKKDFPDNFKRAWVEIRMRRIRETGKRTLTVKGLGRI